jgi:hypothetical protein
MRPNTQADDHLSPWRFVAAMLSVSAGCVALAWRAPDLEILFFPCLVAASFFITTRAEWQRETSWRDVPGIAIALVGVVLFVVLIKHLPIPSDYYRHPATAIGLWLASFLMLLRRWHQQQAHVSPTSQRSRNS